MNDRKKTRRAASAPSGCAAQSVKAQYDLSGRVCVVAGGAGFLGIQFAEALAEMGGTPVVLDVAGAALDRARESLRGFTTRSAAVACDVGDLDSVRAAAASVVGDFGRADVLVNAAAMTHYSCGGATKEEFFAPFEETVAAVWDAGLRINLTGVANTCRIFGSLMAGQGKGSIVNIGSDVGVISPDPRIYAPDPAADYPGMPFNTPAFYAVTKAGVIHLTKYLAVIWARSGVRVNAFSPAGVYRDHDPGFVKKLSERIPMNRMAWEHEYKGAIVFLASDASSFMTGHNLVMDGGRTIW